MGSLEQTKTGNLIIEGNLITEGFKMLTGAEAGEVLTTNASGVASWQEAAGGGLWTQTGDDIYYNDGHVGIGTTNPGTAKLKISGGSLDMSFQKITNLAEPTENFDAVTKVYADTLVAGFPYGDDRPVYVLTTAIGAGTYNAVNLTVDTVKSGTPFGDSLTGTYLGARLLPDTGQTVSKTTTFGEDHDYTSTNSPSTCDMSFTDNGDYTMTDNCTGLQWKKCSQGQNNDPTCSGSCTYYTWLNALTACESLVFGGHDDWRVPNMKELISITNYTQTQPTIDTVAFPNTLTGRYYWTSTTDNNNAQYALGIQYSNLADRLLYRVFKTSANYPVRCVRN